MKTRNSIFRAVFPTATTTEAPTPSATPQVDGGSFSRPQSKLIFEDREEDDVASRNTRWERAWHFATTSLLLPTSAFSPPDQGHDIVIGQVWTKRWSEETAAAVSYLARHESLIKSYAESYDSRALVQWYGWEVTRHFVTYQLPVLIEIFQDDDVRTALVNALQLLEFTQSIYLYPLSELILPHLGPLAQQHFSRFRDWHHALVAKALDTSGYAGCLANFLKLRLSFIFEISKHQTALDDSTSDLYQQHAAVVLQLKRITEMINKVGLGGTQAQQVYAEVIDELVSLYIVDEFSWPNVSGTGVDGRLSEWINSVLGPLLQEVTQALGNVQYTPDPQKQAKFQDEMESWKRRATHELAARRLTEAFGIIANWGESQSASENPQNSIHNAATTGLEEMATFFHTATGRAHVASKLISIINQRLLMPGAATIEILRVYVNIFLAFNEIDKTGLLLARIIRPIRRYLRERPDTVKIIIQALLLDYQHRPNNDEALNAFAQLVQDLHEPAPADDEAKPLYDLQWSPDPVDAAPEWRSDDRPEIITKLIEIFDAKDIFVKEFQNTLSASLLQDQERNRARSDKETNQGENAELRSLEDEIRVLELFKAHLGEAPLQACEVMLKDVRDSQRINEVIKKEQFSSAPTAPAISARILSRFYWPALNREHMLVPAPVERVQARYETGFEAYKPSRKLTWLQNLGNARVELHLKDRVVEQVVHTWQASVIYAFGNSDESGGDQPVRKTVEDLEGELQMDDELIEAALAFWTAKRVLRKVGDAWEVLETLPSKTGAAGKGIAAGKTGAAAGEDASESNSAATANSAAEAAGLSAIRRSEQKAAEEKMGIFWQFTLNMLKNQGAMPLQVIVMRLNMVVPGGFPFSNEEFKAFLGRQVEQGKLELAGGKYKLVK